MAVSKVLGAQQQVSAVTTWTLVNFDVRPRKISIQAGTVTAYLRMASGVDGAALGTDYWPIAAGTVHTFDIANSGLDVNIAAASSDTVYVWGE